MTRRDSSQNDGGCFSFSCGCFAGGCLSGLLVASLAVLAFTYGYWVGIVSHPGQFAYVRVRGEEMRPTLRDGDVVLVDRSYYGDDGSRVGRGDLVYVEATAEMDRGGRLPLRVAGLPGETLTSDASGTLLVDGKRIPDFGSLAALPSQTTGESMARKTLGRNELFLISDNPSYADDDRVRGVVPLKNLRGRTTSILFPPNRVFRFHPTDDRRDE